MVLEIGLGMMERIGDSNPHFSSSTTVAPARSWQTGLVRGCRVCQTLLLHWLRTLRLGRYAVIDSPDERRRKPCLLRAAAWVPAVDEKLPRWVELEQAAVEWIVEQATADGVTPVVFYTAAKAHGGPGPVHRLAARCGYSYPRDRGWPRGAVLAVRPDAQSLRRAADIACGSALVVLESMLTPLAG